MRIAPDGYMTIALFSVLTIVSSFVSHWISLIFAVVLYFALWFFRDPERSPERPLKAGDFLSPADGKVVEIHEAENEYTGRAVKIGIFMNGTNVHVNRFPTKGIVEYVKYVPGKKWFAIAPKASEINERFYVGAMSEYGRFTLVQIAGIMARRIAPHVKVGDIVQSGERYGMIKLGSKVDIYLPPCIVPCVKIGDKVKAGHTIIGVMSD
ncbi:MAG: phosphatidylserine decarboxylase [Synergistes sp.]|nr:phosphatidylserine decarboxylase [Synergistes sp.]